LGIDRVAVNGAGVVVVKGVKSAAGEIAVNVEVEMDIVSVRRLIFVVCDVGWERGVRRASCAGARVGAWTGRGYVESWTWNGWRF
jgi:hypothetical protein